MSRNIEGKTAKEWFDSGYNYNKSGNYKKVIECYKKAVKIDPQDGRAWYSFCYMVIK